MLRSMTNGIVTDYFPYVMCKIKNIFFFYVGLKLQVRSLFCNLFQVHSTFRCVVMCANAKRCSRLQNEIIASKRELPVKT